MQAVQQRLHMINSFEEEIKTLHYNLPSHWLNVTCSLIGLSLSSCFWDVGWISLSVDQNENCFEIAKRTPAGSGEEVFDEVLLLDHSTGQADETEP